MAALGRKKEAITKQNHSDETSLCIFKPKLRLLKLKAIRQHLWYRALSRVDRALVDATLQISDHIRSSTLSNALLVVVRKLESASENLISWTIQTVGFSRAREIAFLAMQWGNHSAINWQRDAKFARFLAVLHINVVARTDKI